MTKSFTQKIIKVIAKNNLVTKDFLDDRLKTFKDDLYAIKDEIMGELKGLREEFHSHQYSHVRINDEIQDHEKRINKLETAKI